MEYIIDASTDSLLMQSHAADYNKVISDRYSRKISALKSYLQQSFPNDPLPSLSELEHKLNIFNRMLNGPAPKTEEQSAQLTFFIQQLQSNIDNGLYYTEGSPEHQYRINYDNTATNFLWPTQDELLEQNNEKNQLLGLLNNG